MAGPQWLLIRLRFGIKRAFEPLTPWQRVNSRREVDLILRHFTVAGDGNAGASW